MSSITSAVLIMHHNAIAGYDMEQLLGPIGDTDQGFGLADDQGSGGGSKESDLTVYVAGFNYMDLGVLEAWFRGLPWSRFHRDSALLYTVHEYAEVPIIFRLED